jgi:hypothetical protein
VDPTSNIARYSTTKAHGRNIEHDERPDGVAALLDLKNP